MHGNFKKDQTEDVETRIGKPVLVRVPTLQQGRFLLGRGRSYHEFTEGDLPVWQRGPLIPPQAAPRQASLAGCCQVPYPVGRGMPHD